jgi:hypothetical protein
MPEPLRSHTSFVAGLDNDSARYCARLRPGDVITLTLSRENPRDAATVVLHHGDRYLGVIPPAHGWVGQGLAEGDTLACSIAAVEVTGVLRRRAARVELRIDVLADGSALGRAVQWSATNVTHGASIVGDIGGKALRAAVEVPVATARGAKFAARWTGRNVAAPAVDVIYRSVDGVAEIAVRKPARAMRRLVFWVVGLAFGALALVLAILILLHTLPRRG